MLALDPVGDPTIAECVLDDLHGPRSHRYGRMRDLLLGVTVVLDDGLVANSGGKVVKNVAGYDLGKLFCGSRGTLGVVCRASLRLHPLPDAVGDARRARRSGEDEAKRQAILRSTLVPSALDVTDERLAVMFEGGAAAVEFQLGAARKLVGGKRAGDEVWDEVRARPRPHVATDDPVLRALHERIRAAFAAGVIERELIDACTHCGFCLPTCPTYGPLGQMEADSPRGRIWLMKGLADGTMTVNSVRRRAHRPLPRLYGVRDRVPVRRALRPADRADAGGRRGAVRPARGRLAAADTRLLGLPVSAAAASGTCLDASDRDAAAEAGCARWPSSPLPGGHGELPPEIDAFRRRATRPGRAADGLRAERRLRRRERRDRPRAGGGGLRRRHSARPSVLRRAPSPCRPA